MDWEGAYRGIKEQSVEAGKSLYDYYCNQAEKQRLSRYLNKLIYKYVRDDQISKMRERFESEFQDYSQEVMNVVIKKIQDCRLRSAYAIGKFVHETAYRLFLKFRRKYNKEPIFLNIEDYIPFLPGPSEQFKQLQQKEERRMLYKNVKRLAETDKFIIEKRVFDDLPFKRIDELLKKDSGYAKDRYHELAKILRKRKSNELY